MFTGIIEEIGRVGAIVQGNLSIRIFIDCSKILEGLCVGDSISVNGICLTVTDWGDGRFSADVMPETVRNTNLNMLRVSDKVNLERALKLSDRLGGHIVTGHIDGIGTIIGRNEEGNAVWLTVRADAINMKHIVMKGSIALDGTSLTIAFVDGNCFKVSLIPHTMGTTTLGWRKPGDRINIECDIVGKYVERILKWDTHEQQSEKEISMDFLKDNGFI